ncbi:MAG: hypothetical protein DI616_15615 [Paracoccus denitrificans]|uniref:Uncharacterized protein n=1 Tax=Paracoccus denitrificans TaxID=266 RepID=A0A533I276_PARDE|nr:MAG: hypothetical protein DI616_15615 [Paracoccus denitrificans]
MATGLKTWAPDGTLLVDMTKTFSQEQGFVDTNNVNGSITMPPLPVGKTRFTFSVALSGDNAFFGKKPGITVSGDTLSWAYSYADGWGYYSLNCRIYYGYY